MAVEIPVHLVHVLGKEPDLVDFAWHEGCEPPPDHFMNSFKIVMPKYALDEGGSERRFHARVMGIKSHCPTRAAAADWCLAQQSEALDALDLASTQYDAVSAEFSSAMANGLPVSTSWASLPTLNEP